MVDVTHDRNHRSARHFEFAGILGHEYFFDCLVGQFFFVADNGCACTELGSNVLHHGGVERLVHGYEYTAHQQCCDQVLGANFELLGQILHADAFSYGDFAGDRQRLIAEVRGAAKTWWRHKALHWAFLGLWILLATAAGAILRCALRARRLTGRRSAAGTRSCAKAAGAWSAKSGSGAKSRSSARGTTGPAGSCKSSTRRVLGTWTSAGELPRGATGSRRTLLESSRRARWSAIKDWLAALNTPALCRWRNGTRYDDGRLVHRARSCLRHNHTPWSDHRSRRRGSGLGSLRNRSLWLHCDRLRCRRNFLCLRGNLGSLRSWRFHMRRGRCGCFRLFRRSRGGRGHNNLVYSRL